MPITIKELFPSDPLSEALEKINFNFDQLILAGGGPPGPAGPIGPQGVPGPLGPRGDHWFVGPSAFGQTADHDGGSLKVKDNFLDSLGDVYSYFDISGVTGWTSTGVNLMGPTGPSGATGGSDDVTVQAGGSGNAVTPSSAGYGPQASTTPTTLIDFWFPKNMGKNSIFVGDIDWSVNYLQNFGSNSSALTDQNSVPQLSIIQKNMNASGLNGLMLGVLGGGYGPTSNALPEGSTGATTSAFDFVHLGFAKPFTPQGATFVYDRMFRIKSFRQKFKIEIGGNGTYEALAPFEIASKTLSWINNTNGQFLSSLTRQGIVSYDLETVNGIVGSGIDMFSKPDWTTSYANQKYGIIGFQNVEGNAPNFANFNNAHGFGNVHIGATVSGVNPIGTRMQQAIGIARPISFGGGNNDAAIRFFGTDLLQSGNEWSAIAGGIRHFNQSITNSLGTIPIRAIQLGAGYAITGTPTPSTQSRQVGGRIGINNHPSWNDFNAARSINMPIHFNLGGYFGIDRAESPFPGQPVLSEIEQWALGVDYAQITGSESGIYHAGWDNDSPGLGVAYSHGYSGATGTWTSRNIVLQSYYVGTSSTNPLSSKRTPNLYSQVGAETNHGNLGLGFTPKAGVTPSKTEAWSKLSIHGSQTIGDWALGYHQLEALRPSFGLLIQGAIYQGATGSTGILSTSVYGSTGVQNGTSNTIKISSDGFVMGDKFISRDLTSSNLNISRVPSYSFSDLRTGIDYIPGVTGRGFFTTPGPEVVGPTGGYDPNGPTAALRSPGYWGVNSGEGTQGSEYAPAIVASNRHVEAPTYTATGEGGRTYTLQDLVNNGFATNYSYTGGGLFSSTLNRRQVWLVIPSNHSTAILDLSGPAANFGYWSDSGNWIPYNPNPLTANTTLFYLDGTSVTSTGVVTEGGRYSSIAPLQDQFGLTIQPGQYDGQKLTVIIKNVNVRNAFHRNLTMQSTAQFTNKDLWYVRLKSEYAFRSFGLNDNNASPGVSVGNLRDIIVMSRDYLPSSTLPNRSPSFYSNGAKLPYPVPEGAEATGTNWNGVAAGTTANIFTNYYNPASADGKGWFTDRDKVEYGSGGALFINGGWKVINFVWLNDYASTPGTQRIGCWVETSRENLAPRGTKNNTGASIIYDPGDVVVLDPGGGVGTGPGSGTGLEFINPFIGG